MHYRYEITVVSAEFKFLDQNCLYPYFESTVHSGLADKPEGMGHKCRGEEKGIKC